MSRPASMSLKSKQHPQPDLPQERIVRLRVICQRLPSPQRLNGGPNCASVPLLGGGWTVRRK